MKKSKAIMLVAAGLVAGLVLGSVSLAAAAPADYDPESPVVCAGLGFGRAVNGAGARLIDIVADLTGLSTDEIAAERADGNSLADIAEANGVESDEVVSEALDVRKQLLDERVADGTLTQEQADLMLETMTERLGERIETDEVGPPSWGGPGRGGMRGGQGFGGQGACGGMYAPAQ
ncbi:MAG: hypothetical protein Kow0067_12380 [Coriobacteriia bacterium]